MEPNQAKLCDLIPCKGGCFKFLIIYGILMGLVGLIFLPMGASGEVSVFRYIGSSFMLFGLVTLFPALICVYIGWQRYKGQQRARRYIQEGGRLDVPEVVHPMVSATPNRGPSPQSYRVTSYTTTPEVPRETMYPTAPEPPASHQRSYIDDPPPSYSEVCPSPPVLTGNGDGRHGLEFNQHSYNPSEPYTSPTNVPSPSHLSPFHSPDSTSPDRESPSLPPRRESLGLGRISPSAVSMGRDSPGRHSPRRVSPYNSLPRDQRQYLRRESPGRHSPHRVSPYNSLPRDQRQYLRRESPGRHSPHRVSPYNSLSRDQRQHDPSIQYTHHGII